MTKRYGLVLVLLLIAGSALVIPAGAAVTISPSGGDDTVAITDAITSAGATDGIVILDPGTYFARNIIVGNTVTIRANATLSGTAANTIIDAGGLGRIFSNNGHTLSIDNLTLQNGNEVSGGAIYNSGTLIITGSSITDCSETGGVTGGGAIFNSGTVTITGSGITDCSADGIGGGAIYNTGTLTITASSITNCSAEGSAAGGAIYNSGTATITGSGITGCRAYYGGAIYTISDSTLVIDSSQIVNCQASAAGGAIGSTNSASVTIRNGSLISGCTAGTDGGAIVSFTPVTVQDSEISHCTATNNGGAIYLNNGGSLTASGATFDTDTATNGGAIDNHGTSMITSSTLTGCTASNNGGAIYSSGLLTITSSTFTGNAAGAIGSAIYSTGSGSSVHFSRFYQNLHPVWGVVHSPTSFEAQNNWWGTNNTPPTPGYVNERPWLVLGATASPASITMAQTATITVNLTYDSDNAYHIPASGHVPDGIPVAFSLSGISGTLGPLQGNVSTGANATMFTPASGGTAHITATVDGETVTLDIPVTGVVPAVTGITPNNGVNTSPVAITNLAGTGFWTAGTTTVNLTRAGRANITTTTMALSTTQITCTLPITGAEAGQWDVVVVNPDGQEGVLADGFTIIAGVPTTVPTAAPPYTGQDTGTLSDFPSGGSVSPAPTQAGALPPMTVTVNIGGNSKAWQAIVTGTQLSGLIVTGTVQSGPGTNQTAPPGTVYQYVSLIPARYTSITKAVINFTVPQAWLDENHIDPKSIVLYHQTANGWEALPTTVLYTKDGAVYFSAESFGFSLFAIAGMPGITVPAPEVTAMTNRETMSDVVRTPIPAAAAEAPVTTQTTAPPAASAKPAALSPLLNIILVIAAIGILAGGGFMVRRWWIRRQNPALFAEDD